MKNPAAHDERVGILELNLKIGDVATTQYLDAVASHGRQEKCHQCQCQTREIRPTDIT